MAAGRCPGYPLLLSIGICVALPLVAGYVSRKWLISTRGETCFNHKFLLLVPVVAICSFAKNTLYLKTRPAPMDRSAWTS